MPIRSNPIRRPLAPHYNEASDLRSPRDADSVSRQWRRNAELASQIQWLTDTVKQLQWQLNRLRLHRGSGDDEGGESNSCPYA